VITRERLDIALLRFRLRHPTSYDLVTAGGLMLLVLFTGAALIGLAIRLMTALAG
jgi:hypothetical protein